MSIVAPSQRRLVWPVAIALTCSMVVALLLYLPSRTPTIGPSDTAGSIAAPGDLDWFKLKLKAGDVVGAIVTGQRMAAAVRPAESSMSGVVASADTLAVVREACEGLATAPWFLMLDAGQGEVPGLLDRFYEGNRPNGFYIPRFRNLQGPRSDRLAFSRGYGYQGGAGRGGWSRGIGEAGIGVELKEKLHDPGLWGVGMLAFGEAVPVKENRVWLDAERKDRWGIPQLPRQCADFDFSPSERCSA